MELLIPRIGYDAICLTFNVLDSESRALAQQALENCTFKFDASAFAGVGSIYFRSCDPDGPVLVAERPAKTVEKK